MDVIIEESGKTFTKIHHARIAEIRRRLVKMKSRKDADAILGLAEALLVCGLVPRTFGPDHPLADCLRLTVRSAQENDRLIAAAREIPA